MTPGTEREVQTAIVHVARRLGWYVVVTSDRRRALAKGMPDLYCTHPGKRRCVWLEVKGKKGKASLDQLLWMRRVQAAEGESYVVHSVDEALAILT